VHKISKSQAWQRTGRAGREAEGSCYRLYSEAEFEAMPLNTVPEILRSNLLSVALQLIALGIDDLANFDFISKPSPEALCAALDELELLGAIRKIKSAQTATNGSIKSPPISNGHEKTINGNGFTNGASNGHHHHHHQSGKNGKNDNSEEEDEVNSYASAKKRKLSALLLSNNEYHHQRYELTAVGKKMAQFPLEPKLAKCVLAAEELGSSEEVLKIVSILSVESVFLSNGGEAASGGGKNDTARLARQKFVSADGDHVTLLNIYRAYVSNKGNGREWCRDHQFDLRNLKMAVDVCKQIREVCARNGVRLVTCQNDTVKIRHALISGFFTNAAEYHKENEYKTVSFVLNDFFIEFSLIIMYRVSKFILGYTLFCFSFRSKLK
jgi:HrpA-like RNA helicase